MRRLPSWVGNVALLVFGLALPLLLAEGVLRVLARNEPGGKEQVERNSYTEYDSVLGWRKKPGARVSYVRRDYRSEFTVNPKGLRGSDRPYEKPVGSLRVLALGDSFVEAFMVGEAETISAQLESQLKPRLPCPTEVVNGGTVGYSTDQEYLFYRDEGRRYAPDVVILFTYHNDFPFLIRDRYYAFPKPRLNFEASPPRIENEPVPPYVPEPPIQAEAQEPFRGSHLLEFVKDRVERSSARTYNRIAALGVWEPLRTLPQNEEINLYRVPPFGHLNAVWSAYTWTVESLNRLAQSNQTRLVIAYIPSRMEVSDSDYEVTEARYGVDASNFSRTVVRDRVSEIAERLEIPFLDFTPALKERTSAFRPVYFPTDSHWNARGQAAAAEAAATFLTSRRLLTCPPPPPL